MHWNKLVSFPRQFGHGELDDSLQLLVSYNYQLSYDGGSMLEFLLIKPGFKFPMLYAESGLADVSLGRLQ